jgi:hypothetical protein
MPIRLDDNERGAFNYLVGGLLVVVALRAVAWVLDAVGPGYTADGAALQPFQHGYWGMRNQLAVAGGTAELNERLIMAVVAGVGAAFVTAFLFLVITRARGRSGGRTAILTTRTVLVVAMGWCLYAALCLPPREVRLDEGRLVETVRPSIAGILPLPFGWKSRTWARPDVDRITAREQRTEGENTGSVVLELFKAGGKTPEVIAMHRGIKEAGRMEALRGASEASALLERELR